MRNTEKKVIVNLWALSRLMKHWMKIVRLRLNCGVLIHFPRFDRNREMCAGEFFFHKFYSRWESRKSQIMVKCETERRKKRDGNVCDYEHRFFLLNFAVYCSLTFLCCLVLVFFSYNNSLTLSLLFLARCTATLMEYETTIRFFYSSVGAIKIHVRSRWSLVHDWSSMKYIRSDIESERPCMFRRLWKCRECAEKKTTTAA